MSRATTSLSVSRAAPAMRAARPVAGVAARPGVTRAEPEAVAVVEKMLTLLVEHGQPASARERAVVERAATYLAHARRGGARP